jgi:uncharacterized peroxidase-related enzyme
MTRITHLDPQTTTGPAKALFEAAQAKLGVVPNLFRVLANAPAALRGYLDFSNALGDGAFDGRTREQIALAVAESNQCGYCLSAHSFIGRRQGLTDRDIADARNASAPNVRTDAILKLARSIVVPRGDLAVTELERARLAGLTDADIVETVANVALNIFSNYINHIAGTVVDFPEVKPGNGHVSSLCDCA